MKDEIKDMKPPDKPAPREFWGYHTGEVFANGCKVYELHEQTMPNGKNPEHYNDLIHVIEYEYAKALELQVEELKLKVIDGRRVCSSYINDVEKLESRVRELELEIETLKKKYITMGFKHG